MVDLVLKIRANHRWLLFYWLTMPVEAFDVDFLHARLHPKAGIERQPSTQSRSSGND
jgi:hypothetical protein